MKILITGFTGFVCAHFLDYLNMKEPNTHVLGLDKNTPGFNPSEYPDLKIDFRQIDLLDKASIQNVLVEFQPGYVLHLASVSSVAQSWQAPLDSFVNNTNIFLNLVEQIRINHINCRILSVGSSEEYGQVNEKELPLTEEHPLRPLSPYAVARVSQEMLSKIYADGYNLNITITRSFNHIGTGQREFFVVSSFAKQLVELQKSGAIHKKIITGDLSIVRDFLDVRDVVRAYYLLLMKGRKAEVYNICSGNGIILRDIITKMSEILKMKIEIEVNPGLIRPSDNMKIVGSYQKIQDEFGWAPEIPLEKSLSDIIAYWQEKIN
jgi:GDP-4-dehydro-6-deoxy-D-mannose reductase